METTFPRGLVAEVPAPDDARTIAKDAYIYDFPMVDSYRIQYDYFQDKNNAEFKAPRNHIANVPRISTAADTTAQTPNADTPYSWLGLDLRAEPIVLTMPVIAKDRYFTVQLIDAYTFNFAYIGSRATGNDGGSFLLAGPNWKGETPRGGREVIRSETEFMFAFYRTQLFEPGDKRSQRISMFHAVPGAPRVLVKPTFHGSDIRRNI